MPASLYKRAFAVNYFTSYRPRLGIYKRTIYLLLKEITVPQIFLKSAACPVFWEKKGKYWILCKDLYIQFCILQRHNFQRAFIRNSVSICSYLVDRVNRENKKCPACRKGHIQRGIVCLSGKSRRLRKRRGKPTTSRNFPRRIYFLDWACTGVSDVQGSY